MGTNKQYDENSISSLKGADRVRKRPSVIFGTNDEKGAAHGIYEIIANSIDEHREGYGNKISVTILKSGDVTVEDDGRGVPMEWNAKENKYGYELVFETLYASGKYNSDNYATSLGLNGLGATATQYASEYMDVYSTRDGVTYHMHFEKGTHVGKLEKTAPIRKGTGTKIVFKPDPEVFAGLKANTMPPEYFANLLRRQAMLHAGLEIVFYHEDVGKPITFYYPEGLKGFIDTVCEKQLIKQAVEFEGEDFGYDDDTNTKPYKLGMRIGFTFSRDYSLIELYHNGSLLYEGGVTLDAVKTAMPKAFEDYAKDLGKISRADRFNYKDIESILVCIGDTSAPGYRTYFKNQTKAAINNPFIKQSYTQFIYNSVMRWIKNDKISADRVLGEIILNKTAREEAEKVSKKVVSSLSKSISGLGNKPKKFVDCKSSFVPERELFIVEGDSALGSCKLARNAEFQAIMPLRGKTMNCLKEDLTTILNSTIIVDLLKVLGCGIEAESKYIEDLPKFDITKLNWGKIIICTDADIDGMQIRCLVLTMLYRLCPTVLKAGKVFIAETPLFEVIYKDDTQFAYTEEEKVEILNDLAKKGVKDSQIKINRSKGLGENDADMMSKSTMHPLTRRLVPVEYPEDDSMVPIMFEALLGSDIEGRKILIEEWFKYTDVDVD